MELLHIYAPDGAELPSEDLSQRTKSLLVCIADGRVTLAETAAPGTEVAAALVRNEDGWELASSNPEVLVMAGPKSAPDMQLMPGLVCSIAGFAFRLERDQAASGCTLLWRYDRSKVVADPVVAGRNVVAENASDGKPCVNPALAGDTLFEFFPAADGIDVVTGTGDKRQRLNVSAGTLFAVGGFEAMYLSAKDAAEAMKSASPFGWPSRKPRRGLLLGLAAFVALCACVGVVKVQQSALVRQLAAPRHAQQVEPMFGHEPYIDAADRATIYEVQFYRALPSILTADPSPLAEDLIRTGLLPEFTNDVTAARRVAFLRDVTKIQIQIKTGRWDELKDTLDKVDRAMFTQSDAEDFYRDAVEVMNFVNLAQPACVQKVLDGDACDASSGKAWKEKFETLQNKNLFMTGVTLKRELSRALASREIIRAYIAARNRLRERGMDATSAEVTAMTDAYCALRDQLSDASYGEVMAKTTSGMREIALKSAAELMKLPDGDANDVRIIKLSALVDLAGQVGVPETETEAWRTRAKGSGGRLALRYQKYYQLYRLKCGSDRALAEKTLDEMIDIGFAESPYYSWALREKERIARK